MMEAAATTTYLLNPRLGINKHPTGTARRPASRRLHAFTPVSTVSARAAPSRDLARHRLRLLADDFRSLPQPLDRVKGLLAYASALPALPESGHVPENRVAGCTAQVWLSVEVDGGGERRMRFAADSDSEIAKGFISCLLSVLDGARAEEVLEMRVEDFSDVDLVGALARATYSRVNTWHNGLTTI